MSRYRITLDGKLYEMEVELLDGVNSGTGRVTDVKTAVRGESIASLRSDVRVVDSSVRSETHVDEGVVLSPMPGTVSTVLVGPGQRVVKGQTVLVLEAMKMENDIAAPRDGAVGCVFVGEGQAVQGGAPLFEMA